MKILYITTAMEQEDYRLFSKLWSIQPNPSNQIFNNKMIRSISLTHEVDVLSIRPLSRQLCSVKSFPFSERKDGNIYWHYTGVKHGAWYRRMLAYHDFKKCLGKKINKEYIILVDTINPTCLVTAAKIKEQYKIPLIGICTTSPSNIHGTMRSYAVKIFETAKNCDGYISLTEDINDLYNENYRHSLVFEGIVDEERADVPIEAPKPYFFYSGSMLNKYGVYNLIKAFREVNNLNYELLIAGHTLNKEEYNQNVKKTKNIRYLGTLPLDVSQSYQRHAIANVNPRPISQDLNRYSVPSKLLEYLTSGSLTISTKNDKITSLVDDAIWVDTNSVEDLKAALLEAIDLKEEARLETAQKAREKVLSIYSLEKINEKLNEFFKNFQKRR